MTEPLLPANWATGNTFTAANENLVENSANWAQGGRVYLDSFAGANDDAKLTAAMTYAAAQTHIPSIVFPARTSTFSTTGRTPYTGLRIVGPDGCLGPKNIDVSTTMPNHLITLNVGADASAWFVGGGDTYDVYMGGLAIQNGNGASQFWSHTTGTLYAAEFNSMTFYGMNHIFGSAATQCNFTQIVFSGHWEIIGGTGCQFYIGGSDCCLWMPGYCNMQNGGAVNADTYMMKFSTLAKTSVGFLRLICSGGWSGIQLSGSNAYGGVSFHGSTFTGTSAAAPSTAAPVSISGNDVSFHGCAFNYTTTANGVVVQSGGSAAFFGPSYAPAASAPSLFLYQTAGSAVIMAPCTAGGGNFPVRWSDGTTPNLAFNALSSHP